MTFIQQLANLCCEYEQTLSHFRQGRSLIEAEKFSLGRAIQQHGYDAVRMALIGARYEPKGEKFDPADWVNLDRYLMAKNFKRFVGLGARQRDRGANATKERPAIDWGPLGPPMERGEKG